MNDAINGSGPGRRREPVHRLASTFLRGPYEGHPHSMTRSLIPRTLVRRATLLIALFAILTSSLALAAPRKKKARHRGGARAPMVAAPADPKAPPKPGDKGEPELPPASLEDEATRCPGRIPPGVRFKWDLPREVELKDLVDWVTHTMCKPVIVPSTLRQQKVQIFAPQTINQAEAFRMFLAALNSMGITIQPEGNSFLLVETVSVKERALPFIGPDGRVPDDARYVTKVARLEHVSTEEVMTVLQRLKTKDGDIVPYAPTGTLIITDVAENIRRMDEVIKMIDIPMGSEKIWTVALRGTVAADVATLLEKIFQPKEKAGGGGGAGGAGARGRPNLSAPSAPGGGAAEGGGGGSDMQVSLIIPVERANMLIIVANEKTYRKMQAVIVRLEQAALGPSGDQGADRIHVYPLANAMADDIGQTLSGLGVGVSMSRSGSGSGAQRGGVGQANNASQASQSGSMRGSSGTAGLFEGEVKVAADKPTNSLVIIASGPDYYKLRDIIRKLDVSRRQVYIEATVLEVSVDNSRKLGLAYHAGGAVGSGSDQSLVFGGLEPNSTVNSLAFNPLALSGIAGGLRGPNIPGADTILGLPTGTSVPSFGVFIQALQNNNDVNVVQMPHILTTDNEKANIDVGQNLPFPGMLGGGLGGVPGLAGAAGATGALGALGGFGGFGQSVQRQDVALKLEITPHVNEDQVRLEIDSEISDVAADNYNGMGPATNKRKVKTTIVVRDQQPVVLGGLMKDKVSESENKIPLLGDIPILGYLFKYTTKTVTKQNLLIIITPYVIRDPSDLRRIFERKVRERKEFLERFTPFRDDNNFEANIDYRHKRGLLEEINRTATDAEKEAVELEKAERRAAGRLIEGAIEVSATPPAPKPLPGAGKAPAGAPTTGTTAPGATPRAPKHPTPPATERVGETPGPDPNAPNVP